MPLLSSCPDTQTLRQFLAGEASDSADAFLEQHLLECPRCVQHLGKLKTDSALLKALRKPAPAEAPAGEVGPLVRRLCQLPGLLLVSLSTVTPAGKGDSPTSTAAEQRACLAPAQAADEIGRLGPYRVLKVLGAGGMGVVFQAEDPGLKRLVAVKALLPALAAKDQARQRFLREARAVAALKHPNIVTVYRVEQEGDVPYLVMELLEGETLEERLKREGQLPLTEAVRIARETAEGLTAAHARGLIHRDIKPANLWLERKDEGGRMKDEKPRSSTSGSSFLLPPSSFPTVKILDFGLARPTEDGIRLTQSGLILGTLAYMAPEQARCETLDSRCDLFSLGCVLYRCCTGKLPFARSHPLGLLAALMLEEAAPPAQQNPAVPAELNTLILQLLAKEPARRPASAQRVVQTLQLIERSLSREPGIVEDRGSRIEDRKPAPRPPRSAIRVPRWLAAAMGALTALVAGGAYLALLASRPPAGETHRERPPVVAVNPSPPVGSAKDVPVKALAPPLAVVPFSAEKAIESQRRWATYLGQEVVEENSLSMKLALIPPGEFEMTPDYRVQISKPFRLGVHEVMVDQFRRFADDASYRTDAEKSPEGGYGPKPERRREYTWRHPFVAPQGDHPVAQLSWNDATQFCEWLSRQEKKHYRLPTEAEWEWACRAGSTSTYYFGDDPKQLGDHAWFKGNSGGRSHPVGQKLPNPWGLYDMYGNVAEYCADWFGPYPKGHMIDPGGPDAGEFRQLRSYTFNDVASDIASDSRASYVPGESRHTFGFRVVCEVGP
jgi:serine/threonine protein kinase/formylglycine-generating enzyme required for sulfatase activity